MTDKKDTVDSLSGLLKNADMLPLTERAILFATVRHAGVERKGMTVPYIAHVMEAMEIVSHITDDHIIRAAAVLHDTLEDTDTTATELTELFGEWVTELVLSASEDKREGQPAEATWKIRKEETLKHLKTEGTPAKTVALGDKLSNIRAIRRDLEEFGDSLWNRFNQRDPAQQAWYYRGIAEIFEADETLAKTPAVREYRRLVDEVFPEG